MKRIYGRMTEEQRQRMQDVTAAVAAEQPELDELDRLRRKLRSLINASKDVVNAVEHEPWSDKASLESFRAAITDAESV